MADKSKKTKEIRGLKMVKRSGFTKVENELLNMDLKANEIGLSVWLLSHDLARYKITGYKIRKVLKIRSDVLYKMIERIREKINKSNKDLHSFNKLLTCFNNIEQNRISSKAGEDRHIPEKSLIYGAENSQQEEKEKINKNEVVNFIKNHKQVDIEALTELPEDFKESSGQNKNQERQKMEALYTLKTHEYVSKYFGSLNKMMQESKINKIPVVQVYDEIYNYVKEKIDQKISKQL